MTGKNIGLDTGKKTNKIKIIKDLVILSDD